MTLTEFQKSIVRDILTEKITDIESFITNDVKVWSGKNPPNVSFALFGRYSIDPNQDIFKVMDEKEAVSQLRQFVVLWNQLEKANLVYSLPIPDRKPFPLFKQDGNPYYKALHIVQQFNAKEIVAYPELLDFVNSNFMTIEELKALDEARDRKETLRLTRRVAYISVAISIVLALVTVLFNYLTYTTDRTVTIKNPHAFNDTSKIIILGEPDSGKITRK